MAKNRKSPHEKKEWAEEVSEELSLEDTTEEISEELEKREQLDDPMEEMEEREQLKEEEDLLTEKATPVEEAKKDKKVKATKTSSGKKHRKVTGRVAFMVTAVVTVVVLLINVGLSLLNNKQAVRFDWTTNKAYELTAQTLQYLQSVDQDVEIIVLADEKDLTQDIEQNIYLSQVNEILRNLERANAHITIAYKPLSLNPDLRTRFSDLTLTEGNILVVHGDRKIQIPKDQLFNTTTQTNADGSISTYIASSRAEQVLLSSILSVLQEDAVSVTFLSGVGSVDTRAFQNALSLNGYQVESKPILSEDFTETDVLVLCGPTQDISKEQAEKLGAFLEEPGKTLLFFAAVTPAEEQPVLSEFLKEWGLGVSPNVVYETESNLYVVNQFLTYAEYSQDAFGASLEDEDGKKVLMPYTHPIELLYSEEGNRYTAPLLTFLTSAHGYEVGKQSEENSAEAAPGPRGPFNATAMSTRRFETEEGMKYANLVAVGSEQSIQQEYFSYALADNSNYYVKLLRALYPTDQPSLIIEDKVLDPAQLDITANQTRVLGLVFLWMVPSIVVLGGLFEWLRRRKQ